VVAYALAGRMDVDLQTEPLGTTPDGKPVFLKDIWPAHDEIRKVIADSVNEEEKDLAAKIATLTPQQYRVLCYLREGWLNKQIGYEMGITEATVKAHITAVFRKLGISNRTQAVIMLSKMSLNEAPEN